MNERRVQIRNAFMLYILTVHVSDEEGWLVAVCGAASSETRISIPPRAKRQHLWSRKSKYTFPIGDARTTES